jgi:transcription antitermination factor NusG
MPGSAFSGNAGEGALTPESDWYALVVKHNHERAAAAGLEYKGLEVFLPLYRARRRWSDRVKELELPLFGGYVFCRFREADRALVLTTPGVNSLVGFGNGPAPVAADEIKTVRALLASGLPVMPWAYPQPGDRVRIAAGPLRGVEGVLTQVRNAWRVVVSLELLQRSVMAEVDGAVLSVVHPAPAVRARARAASVPVGHPAFAGRKRVCG